MSIPDTPATLFGTVDELDADAARPQPAATTAVVTGPFAAVALEQSIDRMLDYVIPPRLVAAVQIGQRVRVPLGRGNKPRHGYVVDVRPETRFKDPAKVKSILAVDDQRVLVPPQLMELAVWMAKYYIAPLGQVLECIIPSAVKKRVGIGYRSMVRLAISRADAQERMEKVRGPKRRALLARLLEIPEGEAIELLKLASDAGVKAPTVRRLARTGLIVIRSEVDLPRPGSGDSSPQALEPPRQLNEDQQRVFDEMLPRLTPSSNVPPDSTAGFSVNLLLGVTGSGKTEIYLQCLRRVIDQGRRAIVLVPEIALTPQTVRRFTARFEHVAILHSGLTATQRHRYWQQIASGQAQVVVGARSAIFAPVPNLGVICVDEEHESSYKQDQLPRYHARDVAIKRAQLAGVPILLGSATPSLEMYAKVGGERRRDEETKRQSEHVDSSTSSLRLSVSPSLPSPYYLLSLPRRVRGLSLPHVELIDMKVESRFRRGVNLLSQRLEYLLGNTVAQGQQAILLLNRRGYSNYIHCPSCQYLMTCKYCDKTMTYHRSAGEHELTARSVASAHSGQLHCHYCLAVNPLPTACPKCGKHLSLFGLGTQRVEEELQKKFPNVTFARVDSDTMRSGTDYEVLLDRFGRKEIQVLLGTQMIAKGLDYPNVTLVGVISADTALALPDFRAAERTFQLITQVAGRAGRGDIPGRVIVQTFLPDDPAIALAIKQDYIGFAEQELPTRKELDFPPFGRMVRIVLRDEDAERLQQMSEELAAQFAQAIAAEKAPVKMRGATPCAVGRIAGYFRYQILLQAKTPGPLQRVLAVVREGGHLKKAERIAVDVDPVALL
jgi:primosomal protein N' (replication factor Y)